MVPSLDYTSERDFDQAKAKDALEALSSDSEGSGGEEHDMHTQVKKGLASSRPAVVIAATLQEAAGIVGHDHVMDPCLLLKADEVYSDLHVIPCEVLLVRWVNMQFR